MRPFESRAIALGGLLALVASPAGWAEVTASGPSGFSLKTEVSLPGKPETAFASFLRVGQWWSDEHTYSGKATNMTLAAEPNGCFCERLPQGGFVKHMEVLYSAPGQALRLGGGLGPLQQMGATGVMTLIFKPEGDQVRLIMTYGVSGFAGDIGFAGIAPLVDRVLTEQLTRFKHFTETGKPTG